MDNIQFMNEAEEKAFEILKKIFDDVKYVNGLIDFLCNKYWVEVKSCKEWIKDGVYRRRGRFWFDEYQHRELCFRDGIYLFIVFLENGGIKAKFIKAKDIEFKRVINWKKIMNR